LKKLKALIPIMRQVNGLVAHYKREQTDENYEALQAAMGELRDEIGRIL